MYHVLWTVEIVSFIFIPATANAVFLDAAVCWVIFCRWEMNVNLGHKLARDVKEDNGTIDYGAHNV